VGGLIGYMRDLEPIASGIGIKDQHAIGSSQGHCVGWWLFGIALQNEDSNVS
jgi:hypothetical protein